jgi:hypothetical protein
MAETLHSSVNLDGMDAVGLDCQSDFSRYLYTAGETPVCFLKAREK